MFILIKPSKIIKFHHNKQQQPQQIKQSNFIIYKQPRQIFIDHNAKTSFTIKQLNSRYNNVENTK